MSDNFFRVEKSNLIESSEGVQSPEGIAVFEKQGADVNSPAWERTPESRILQEKLGYGPDGNQACWADNTFLFH